jgi:hypothetical protein
VCSNSLLSLDEAALEALEQSFTVTIVDGACCVLCVSLPTHAHAVDGERQEIPLVPGGAERAVCTHSDARQFVHALARFYLVGERGDALRLALDELRAGFRLDVDAQLLRLLRRCTLVLACAVRLRVK